MNTGGSIIGRVIGANFIAKICQKLSGLDESIQSWHIAQAYFQI